MEVVTDKMRELSLFRVRPVTNMTEMGDKPDVPQGIAGSRNEAALLALMERTGYPMVQENGQRKFGPAPGFEGQALPPRGCEVFVGKIPRECYEDELVPVFEKVGKIFELRLMMDFSGTNRGYCFVQYTNRDDARRAVRELNNYELRKGRFLGVCLSVDNCRLFVGGIPKNKQKDEIYQEMVKVTEGVMDVIVYPSATDKTKNRGFAFVEYDSHRAAAMARRKLIPGRIQLWGHQIAVDWAEPEQEVDEDIMSKVKILYVRNLMLTSTEEALEAAFNRAVGENCVERVKKIRDYAFVHFRERDDALRCMSVMNGSNLDGSNIEVVLAKPADKNNMRYSRGGGRGSMPQMPYGCGFETPYPGIAYYPQMSPATSPTVLTGRTLQGRTHLGATRGTMRGRGRAAAGARGAGGVNRAYMSSYMRSPYRKAPTEDHLYDILPGMELTPTNPVTLKPQSIKNPVQVLEDMCQQRGWGSPAYQLHSTMGRDGGGDVQLFLFKVSIPAMGASSFQPNKLCRGLEEAKNFAAEYTLLQLGLSSEGNECPTSGVVSSEVPSSPPTSMYQGRALGHAYSVTNGAPATSVPIVTTTSYVVTPGHTPKMPQPTPPQASFPTFAAPLQGYAQY